MSKRQYKYYEVLRVDRKATIEEIKIAKPPGDAQLHILQPPNSVFDKILNLILLLVNTRIFIFYFQNLF